MTTENTIPKYNAHVCFVSAQTIPNYLPCIIKGNEPETVYLFVSRQMKDKAKFLAERLEKHHIKVIQEDLSDIDIISLDEKLLNFFSKKENEDIAVNLTGGTKLMTLAANEVCSIAHIPRFYIDTEREKIVSLDLKQEFECSDILNIESILALYGFQITEKSLHKHNSQLYNIVNYIIKLEENDRHIISTLNYFAANADKNSYCTTLNNEINPKFNDLLEQLEGNGLLNFDGNKIDFINEENLLFCKGKWLEFYVNNILAQLHSENYITDYLSSVIVKENQTQNEFDELFTKKNMLYAIECKTSNPTTERGDTKETKLVDAVYKLDNLYPKIGGVYAKGMLVSYFKLSETDKLRCKNYKLKVADGRDDLIKLKDKIKDWIK